MTDAEPWAALRRTAAAVLLAAVAVASCSSGRPARIEQAASSTTRAEAAVNDPAPQDTAPAPPPTDPTLTAAAAPVTEATVSETAETVPETATTVLRIATDSPDDPTADGTGDAREQAPNPVTIRIPRIEVEAPIIPLGLRDDGKIEVPSRTEETGWWLGGPEPGEPGPAVILGHVDSREGPAVFFNLRYLRAGDEVHIDRADGSTLTYVVDSSEHHPKDDFPTDEVYGPTEHPTLRLVTCGGEYDFDVRTYPDNVIVFASLA